MIFVYIILLHFYFIYKLKYILHFSAILFPEFLLRNATLGFTILFSEFYYRFVIFFMNILYSFIRIAIDIIIIFFIFLFYLQAKYSTIFIFNNDLSTTKTKEIICMQNSYLDKSVYIKKFLINSLNT